MGKTVNDMQVGLVWPPSGPISLSLNGTLNFIDEKDTEKWVSIHGHRSPIYSVVCDKKSKKMYSCGSDETLIEWEFGTSNTRFVQGDGHKGIITCIVLQGDNIVSVGYDGTIKFTPKDSFTFNKDKIKIDAGTNDACGSSDGKLVLVSGTKGLFSFKDQKLCQTYTFNYEPQTVDINPKDCTQVVVGGKDKKLRVYSLIDDKLKEVHVSEGNHQGAIIKVKFSPDGKLLACGDIQKHIKVLDTSDWSVKYEGMMHASSVTGLDWTSDSKYLASCSLDRFAYIWDLENKKEIKIQAHFQAVKSLSFMDDNTFVTASEDLCLKSWTFNFKE
jgi:WD40 repeat protein